MLAEAGSHPHRPIVAQQVVNYGAIGDPGNDPAVVVEIEIEMAKTNRSDNTSQWVSWLQNHADFILHVVTPVIWVILFVLIMDRQSFFETWYLPFLGVLAAFLANSVPIGGGIIYIPALSLLGANISLGAAFTIAVMPFGNGVFGFLRWLVKDPTVIIWESFAYTILPSWLGSAVAMLALPAPNHQWIKLGFGFFCLVLGVLVLLAIYRNGLRNVFFDAPDDRLPSPAAPVTKLPFASSSTPSGESDETDALFDAEERQGDLSPHQTQTANNTEIEVLDTTWQLIAIVSFLGGLVLVPNIGIGPALITYLLLVLAGYREQQALVTGIVTGGWVCVLPLLINLLVFQTFPAALWIMVLPGVFLGAKYAPFLIEWIGATNVMYAFSAFLFASAGLYFFH